MYLFVSANLMKKLTRPSAAGLGGGGRCGGVFPDCEPLEEFRD